MNENDDELYSDEEAAQHVGNGPEGAVPSSKTDNLVKLTSNPKSRRVLIATAAAVVVVSGLALVGIRSGNKPQQTQAPAGMTGASVGPAPNSLENDPNSALANSEQYKQMAAATAARKASEALESGRSDQPGAVTVESAMRNSATPAEQEASAAAAVLRAQQQAQAQAALAAAQAQQPTQQQQQVAQVQPDPAYQMMVGRARETMAGLMKPRSFGIQNVSFVESGTGATGTAQAVAGLGGAGAAVAQAAAAASSSVSTGNEITLISAGAIEAARMDTGVNTDIGGDFGATLLTGPFAGAKLIGTVQRKGTLAEMTVTTFSLPAQKITTGVKAHILDAETKEPGTASDVDRKLFIKYGIKPLAAGFAAVASYLQSAGTTVVVNGETVSSTTPQLTTKHTAEIIGGSAAQQVNSDANSLDTTPTVRVRPNTIVGVFFTSDVLYTPKTR